MNSHHRPRGRIFFEVVCALTVGASFVGAWIQTGAWAFIGPAFVFSLFGLYWAFDMVGDRSPAVAVRPAAATPEPMPAAKPAPVADLESAIMPEIRFERFEAPPEAATNLVPPVAEPDIHTDAVPFVPEPQPVVEPQAKTKARKPRATKKAARTSTAQAPVLPEEPHYEQHIEPLFEPQPFARQLRPAFGKRPRGPGPKPLPAA